MVLHGAEGCLGVIQTLCGLLLDALFSVFTLHVNVTVQRIGSVDTLFFLTEGQFWTLKF